jgi:hypothetical protein
MLLFVDETHPQPEKKTPWRTSSTLVLAAFDLLTATR